MESLKLIQILTTAFITQIANNAGHRPVHLSGQRLNRTFSHDEQDIITHMALDDGYSIAQLNSGEPLLVPNKRQNYIFFFRLYSV